MDEKSKDYKKFDWNKFHEENDIEIGKVKAMERLNIMKAKAKKNIQNQKKKMNMEKQKDMK